MKQVEAQEEWREEELGRIKENLLHARRVARSLGVDPDELLAEVKRIEHERYVDEARMQLNSALLAFKLAASQMAEAYENELIDPMALSETWPIWMPAIEYVAADVEKIEPLPLGEQDS